MIIASATRSDNDLLTSAGITVEDDETCQHLGEWTADADELDGPDGWLNESVADEVLRELGFRRASRWILSGGQWAAGVEHA